MRSQPGRPALIGGLVLWTCELTICHLFDHPVDASKQRWWYVEAECLAVIKLTTSSNWSAALLEYRRAWSYAEFCPHKSAARRRRQLAEQAERHGW